MDVNVFNAGENIKERCPFTGGECPELKECLKCEIYAVTHGRKAPQYKTQSNSVGVDLSAEQVFSKYKPMREWVAIYVPSTLYNKPVDNRKWVDYVQYRMAHIFGGVTSYETNGGYVADDGEYIAENVTVVKAYSPNIIKEVAESVIKIALKIKEEMQQEAVSVEYNGQLLFV